jgi:hypothetical protein
LWQIWTYFRSECKKNKTKTSYYTHCNHYLRKGKLSECTPNRINYTYLENDILNYLKEIGKEFIKHYDIRNLVEDSVYVYNRDIEDMQKSLNQIDIIYKKRLILYTNIYNDKLDGVISVLVYKKLSNIHKKELEQLKIKKQELKNKLKIFSDKSEEKEFTKCRDAVEKFMKLKTPSRSTIKNLISKIVVYDGGNEKEVKVFLKFKELNYIENI